MCTPSFSAAPRPACRRFTDTAARGTGTCTPALNVFAQCSMARYVTRPCCET
jgi:hypothetical protein